MPKDKKYDVFKVIILKKKIKVKLNDTKIKKGNKNFIPFPRILPNKEPKITPKAGEKIKVNNIFKFWMR